MESYINKFMAISRASDRVDRGEYSPDAGVDGEF
jgi:hypothetical protein